ncbi:hypothetical protein [Streptomyces puniciscabiei]|uniref:hypothetical protein n=1 Tax=Streptomyces puniciscabiei TaxID=164348 RepID=UPI0033191C3A
MQHVWKPWWPDVASKKVRAYRTQSAALLAERNAICTERPIYNEQGRPPLSDEERLYIHQRALAAIERAKLPGPGVRATRRYQKAARYAVEAGYLLNGRSVEIVVPSRVRGMRRQPSNRVRMHDVRHRWRSHQNRRGFPDARRPPSEQRGEASMSEFADLAVARYLENDHETARAYHLDPQVHADVERMRQFVEAAERAMRDDRVPIVTARRVINRVVFGDPGGLEAVYVSRREQMQAAAKMQPPTADAWRRLLDPDAGPVCPDEEPTT